MHLNCNSTLATLFCLLLVISLLIVEIESCGGKGGKGGGGKFGKGKMKEWGGKKEKKEKKAKSVMSGFMKSVSSSRHHGGYDDYNDDDYYASSVRHHHTSEPKRIVETHYVEVPRYVEMPVYQSNRQPFVENQRPINNNPYGGNGAYASSSAATGSVPYELERRPTTTIPLKETIEYRQADQQPISRPNWPSRHPILSALFRKVIE